MHLNLNLTWKWTLTDSSISSSETFRSGYYSTRQYNDNTHIQTHITHKASCLSGTASFITVVSEEWLVPLEGWGRPSGWATRASEMSWRGKKRVLPDVGDMVHLSYIQDSHSHSMVWWEWGQYIFKGPCFGWYVSQKTHQVALMHKNNGRRGGEECHDVMQSYNTV